MNNLFKVLGCVVPVVSISALTSFFLLMCTAQAIGDGEKSERGKRQESILLQCWR